jgi:hypothetical protein
MYEPDVFAGDGWELLEDAVAQATDTRAARSAGKTESLAVRLGAGNRTLLKEAARQRGISMEGYLRRAVMAFLVADLGLDWDIVMASEPSTAGFGKEPRSGRREHGQGYGRWEVAP